MILVLWGCGNTANVMTIENLKITVHALAKLLNESIAREDELAKQCEAYKRDKDLYYGWWEDASKERRNLELILEKTGMASEPVIDPVATELAQDQADH